MELEKFEKLTKEEQETFIKGLLFQDEKNLLEEDKEILGIYYYEKDYQHYEDMEAKETCPFCGKRGFRILDKNYTFKGFRLHEECLEKLEKYFKFKYHEDLSTTMFDTDNLEIAGLLQMIAETRKEFNNLIDVLLNKGILNEKDRLKIKGDL